VRAAFNLTRCNNDRINYGMITPIGIHAEPRKNITKQKIGEKTELQAIYRINTLNMLIFWKLLLNEIISLLSLFSPCDFMFSFVYRLCVAT